MGKNHVLLWGVWIWPSANGEGAYGRAVGHGGRGRMTSYYLDSSIGGSGGSFRDELSQGTGCQILGGSSNDFVLAN